MKPEHKLLIESFTIASAFIDYQVGVDFHLFLFPSAHLLVDGIWATSFFSHRLENIRLKNNYINYRESEITGHA
jgi:hypothetical protein